MRRRTERRKVPATLVPPSSDPIEQREWLRVTLASIGDAVITTDTQGRITFMNAVACEVTGWADQAIGEPLEAVFRIVNEETRATVENPATRALREGVIVGLANHTVLIAKDGTERAIDDSAAPIRNAQDEIAGVVLLFRDVTDRRRAEQALQVSEERFRLLVEGVAEYAIFMLDPEGHIVSWNQGAERIKGYRAEEVQGKHFSIFYPREAVLAGWPDTELRAAAAEGRFEDEGWRLRKDGSRFWANVVITALRDEHGRIKGFSKITRDLTERKRAEAALREHELRYRRLFETSRDGIVITHAETGVILDANPCLSEMLGIPHDALLGRSVWEVGLFSDRGSALRALEEVRARGYVQRGDLSLSGPSGRRRDIERVSAFYDVDGLPVVQWSLRDISERRELERTTLHAEAMADLNRRKDEFLAMLSHELRNPLAPILNGVHLMRHGEHDPEAQQQARDIIERQVGRLTHLIGDLLDVSRINMGRIRLQIEHVDARVLVSHALDAARSAIAERRHELVGSSPSEAVWIDADAQRIEQALVNLIMNAAKYTPAGGRIDVSLVSEGGEAIFRVRDNGVGISPQLLPRIFDLFTQAERSLDRAEGGLGIGLTVVQRVVQFHGGRVEAHSDGVGQGSEFAVFLPLAQGERSRSGSLEEARSTRTSRLRVLVVDDNRDAADTSALLLQRSGHEVRVVYSGAEVLAEARAFQPDVLLLDLGLPGMDGYEVARVLREEARFADLPLIAVTGYAQELDRRRSREAGFIEHIVKPVDPTKLDEILATVARRS